ncbi:MAG TPA: hypothetical protein VEI97_03450, partial [bacterium]|nr:hypothetical protein [bacterium]
MRVPLPPTASPIKSALALAMLGVLALPCFGQDGHRVNPRPKPRTPQERPADPALAEDPAESDAEAPRDLLSQPAPAGEIPAPLPPPLPADSLLLGDHHHTGAIREGGSWTLDSSFIAQDQDLEYQATLTLRSPGLWYWLPKTKGVYLVVLAQRLFDGQGVYSAGSSGMGTTLLTPTGIPVVSAAPGNPTDAFGGAVRHPGNRFLLVAPDALERMDDQETVVARFLHTIPAGSELPPGWYRFTAQFGVQLSAREFTTLQGANPADLLLNTTTDSAVRYPLTAVKTAA